MQKSAGFSMAKKRETTSATMTTRFQADEKQFNISSSRLIWRPIFLFKRQDTHILDEENLNKKLAILCWTSLKININFFSLLVVLCCGSDEKFIRTKEISTYRWEERRVFLENSQILQNLIWRQTLYVYWSKSKQKLQIGFGAYSRRRGFSIARASSCRRIMLLLSIGQVKSSNDHL